MSTRPRCWPTSASASACPSPASCWPACRRACCPARPRRVTWRRCSACCSNPPTPPGWPRSTRDAGARRAAAGPGRGADAGHAAGSHHHPRQRGARRRPRTDAAPAHGRRGAAGRTLPPAHRRRGRAAQRHRRRPPRRRAARSRLPARAARRLPPRRGRRAVAPGRVRRLGQHRVPPRPAAGPHAAHRKLVDCVLAPEPLAEGQRLWLDLLRALDEQRGLRALLARHYSLLARQVAERSAETGEHYITTTRAEHRDMLRRAAGGGLVIAGTHLHQVRADGAGPVGVLGPALPRAPTTR